jgi:hypothetical protein
VPQIVFSDEERAAIEAVVAEFDPEYHQLTANLKTILSEEDWAFVVESLRKTLRREVEGALVRPVAGGTVDYYDAHPDPEGMDRYYKLGCALEEAHPLEEDSRIWGRSPLWASSFQLVDGAEQAVKERVAAA